MAVGREAAAGLEFTLSDLQDCTVLLLAPLAALFLHGLRRCRVLTGPVAGACFVEGGGPGIPAGCAAASAGERSAPSTIRNLPRSAPPSPLTFDFSPLLPDLPRPAGASDCVLMLAARQVRVHAAQRCDLYLRVRSHPVIEHCEGVRVAPYPLGDDAYPGAANDLAGQQLLLVEGEGENEQQGEQQEEEGGMWRQVDDFGWLRATPSPHWSVLPAHERLAPAALVGEWVGSS